ncbi:MAG: DNA polymerase III subunit alpha, partial [Myxococcota bacterium]
MPDFVHLHVHTQYSLLDGAIRVKSLMKRVAELGMSAVAITDHGNMYGAVDFQTAAKKNGVRSIIGCELYLTKEVYNAEEKHDPKSYHLTVLAKNHTGYKNLMYLQSMAWLEGVHPRTGLPRVDFELLSTYSDGLIVLSGDLGGEINQALLRGERDEAAETARRYKDVFGPEHYYLEIMQNGFPEQSRCNEALVALSDELDIPLVATNDCHYLTRQDAKAHAVLMAIQLGRTVDLEKLMTHGVDQLYVRSPEEMYEAFSALPEACEHTVQIAEMCDLEIPLGEVYLPKFDVPYEFRAQHGVAEPQQLDESIGLYFQHISREGLERRLVELRAKGEDPDEQVYRERLEEELGIILNMDFPGYFLIVWDFIAWAKEQGIPVGPGRGSGAGSLVAYALTITDIDPIPYDLLFERFLNPERVSMPDFDIDFCMNRRGEVIEYVTEKYGEKNVGQIITYGQLKAKACVRDVGRALGLTFGETDRIAKMVPDVLGITLEQALQQEPRLREARREDPRIDALFKIALGLENLNRQAGIHAAGVVISETPLWDYVPICRGANGELVTQYAKNEVEEAGLVKFDFLGLKTLTVIETALKLINEQRATRDEEPFDLATIPMDDQGVFRMISAGDTTGVFQLESSGFQELLKKLKPDCFEDIVAAVALYRPGPLGTGMVDDFIERKHGRKKVEYPHPWLAEVLKPTYGVMVYQEQVMMTARVMAGYSLGG